MRSIASKNDNTAYLYFPIMSPDAYFTSFSFTEHNSATVRNISVVRRRIIERSMRSVACKKDNFASLHFLIIPIDLYLLKFRFWCVTLQSLEVF